MDINSREIIQEIIGWTAFGFSLYIFFIQMLPFYLMIKGKLSIDDTPIALVTFIYISSFCWYIYSDMLDSDQIRIISLIGIILNSFMIIIYIIYEGKKYLFDAVLNLLIIISGSYLIYLVLDTMIEDDETIGKICVGVVCILSIFKIKNILKSFAEKTLDYIYICQSWFTLATVTLWGFYGFMISELYVIILQIIFGFLSIIEISVYAHYKNNKFKINLNNEYGSIKKNENK